GAGRRGRGARRGGHGRRAGGRAHRPCPRRRRDGAGRQGGRGDQTSGMTWLTALLRRPPVGWRDFADILVVWILLYEILKLIRGTRAVQMALGAGFLVALFYGSRWGHLETVDWLIRNLFGYIVFAVIVLFQSDIRRTLAHFGRAPFFQYFSNRTAEVDDSIEEIVVAAANLSGQRVGAIIAIER